MLRVVLAVGAVVVAMVAVRNGALLQRSHVVGGCSAIVTPAGETGSWLACRPGKLEGRPDLSLKSCARRGLVAEAELWRCPAPLVAARTL